MIGQSVINVTSGGRGRLSTFVAGAFLLFLLVVVGDYVKLVPMAALVAVMVMVSINTFSWRSLLDLKRNPPPSSVVMVATVVTVVATHDLSKGVLVGVLLSGIFFAAKVAKIVAISSTLDETSNKRSYVVLGQIFFASTDRFIAGFDFRDEAAAVAIDVSHAHFWDISAIGALDKVVLKLRATGKQVEIIGLNEASSTMIDRFAVHKDEDAVLKVH
jgi:sulfate permease, SulP family